jgi:hypothetical protein
MSKIQVASLFRTTIRATFLAVLCGTFAAPTVRAQSRPTFVLPSLDAAPADNSLVATATPTVSPALAKSYTALTPAVATDTPAPPSSSHRRVVAEANPELNACHKRYADAIYNIGLALWTAPTAQHQALERLLNAAVAAQSITLDPKPSDQVASFCSDDTLNTLEATVVRLKEKGWVPMTHTEEHVVKSANVSDELKHALDAIWR